MTKPYGAARPPVKHLGQNFPRTHGPIRGRVWQLRNGGDNTTRKNVWIPALVIGAGALGGGLAYFLVGLLGIFLILTHVLPTPPTPLTIRVLHGITIAGAIASIVGSVLIVAGARRRSAERAFDRSEGLA